MRYQVLGALRVVNGEAVSTVGARKIQNLLAVLLIRANEVVSLDQLVGELWGEHPPRRATAGLHVHVSQLRKFLDTAAGGADALITRSPGYLIQVDNDDLDLLVFRRLVQKGRSHMRAGRFDEASLAFDSALGLWRGPTLGDLREGAIVTGFVTWAEELRLEGTEMLIESGFALGRHRELISFLYQLVAEHPLRETFYQQLMLALHHCGRRADALAVYHQARQKLAVELGLEPCRTLRELHQAILLDDVRMVG